MSRVGLAWDVPALHSVTVVVPAGAAPLDAIALVLRESRIHLHDEARCPLAALIAARAKAHGGSAAAHYLTAWGMAPLSAQALHNAGLVVCGAIGEPPAALIEELIRDGVAECLASAVGLYRVGSAMHWAIPQLLASSSSAPNEASASARPCGALRPSQTVHCTVKLVQRGQGVLSQAQVALEERTVLFRAQQAAQPLVLRVLLPSLQRQLDADGLCNLMTEAESYDDAHKRAICLLLPSLARVTVLCLASTHERLEQFVLEKRSAAGDDLPLDGDGGGERPMLPRAAAAGLLPLGDSVRVWALVKLVDAADALGVPRSLRGAAADDYYCRAIHEERAHMEHEPPWWHGVFVVNAVHLVDGVGFVPSCACASTQAGQLAVTRARDAVRSALSARVPTGCLGELRDASSAPLVDVAMARELRADELGQVASPADGGQGVRRRGGEEVSYDEDEHLWDTPPASKQPALPPRARSVTFQTAREHLETRLTGGGELERPVSRVEDVLQANGELTALGISAIDAVFARCDRDGDRVLGRGDLDSFQLATGGDALDDGDFAYFLSSFDSISAPRAGLTPAGFRRYFAHALEENSAVALADLKAFAVSRS